MTWPKRFLVLFAITLFMWLSLIGALQWLGEGWLVP